MKQRAIGKISLVFLLYTMLVIYIGWNGWVWLHMVFHFEGAGVWVYSLTVGTIAYSYFIGRVIHRLSFLKIVGSYWMGVFQYAILLLPISNLLVLVLVYVTPIPVETLLTWTGKIVILSFISLFIYGTFNAYSPIIRKYDVCIPKQAGDYKQLRIAMASDMHFGNLSGKLHLRRLVEKVNEIEPDIILLPGDIIDDEPGPFIRKNMGNMMKEMKAPLGIYGVLGNHEYYGGKIPEFLKQMKSVDVKILLDETILIKDSFYLIGRRDRTERNRKSLEELLQGVDKAFPLVMMDHQPFHLDQAEVNGIDLMLSGHTHRGQLAPNHLITRKMFELDWGYLKKKGLQIIVSSGFGFWGPPLRIGSRSEVIQIDIQFK